MPKTKTIKLRDPFAGHGGEVTEMIVREPRAIDYIELGEPVTYARGAGKDGLIVFAENDAAIKGYLERCVSADKADATLIWNMSLRDVQTVKAAVLAFFGKRSRINRTTPRPPRRRPPLGQRRRRRRAELQRDRLLDRQRRGARTSKTSPLARLNGKG